jgi:hypothetical protein
MNQFHEPEAAKPHLAARRACKEGKHVCTTDTAEVTAFNALAMGKPILGWELVRAPAAAACLTSLPYTSKAVDACWAACC